MDIRIIYVILVAIALIGLLSYFKFQNKVVRFVMGFLVCLVVSFGGVISIPSILENTNYGLDLQGGFEVLYQVSPISNKDKLNSDMLYNTYQALVKRVDILGVSEPEITIEGDDRIRVKLAGITNKEEARDVLSSTASLTFRDTTDHLLMTSEVLGGNAKVTRDNKGKPAVSLSIKDHDKFYDVTNKISKKTNNMIVIWLDYDEEEDSYSREKDKCGSLSDSHCLSAATVDQGFSSDVIISGNFTEEEATSLVELINSGALPTKLDEVSSRTVEAFFGNNSLEKTLTAGMIGIGIVILIMLLVYRFAGFIASMGVIIYTMLTFLIFYLINGVLTLPGIAAILLGIGMAVDANVITFERIKEQLKIGKGLKEAFRIGNKDSLTSIIDANITTMIVALIIFIFGESSVKGFATMLIISIIVTVLVMVFFTKLVLKLFVDCEFFENKLNLFIGVRKKQIIEDDDIRIPFQRIRFVAISKYFIGFSVMIIIIGSIISVLRGANLGVDFAGGTNIIVNVNDSVQVDSLKKDMKELGYTVKKVENTSSDITCVIQEVLNKDDIKELTNHLEDKYDTDTDIYTVSKVVKQELTKNAIYSVILASIGILIYVSLRFKFNYAFAAVVALVHDVFMIILFFCIFRIEITSMFVAAILTIIGYSINDTIVTFDMVREMYKKKLGEKERNRKISKKENKKSKLKNQKSEIVNGVLVLNDLELDSVVDDSIRITFFRSILTTLTTIFPVICLMIFGAREIVNFNIALLVGFVVGVYSSIFISNQLWLYLEKKKIKKPVKERKKDDDEIEEIRVKGVNC